MSLVRFEIQVSKFLLARIWSVIYICVCVCGGNTQQDSSYIATNHPSQKLSKLDEQDMQDTAGEVGASS